MSDWKAEFKKALIDTLIKNGSIRTDTGEFNYEWESLSRRVGEVGVDYAATTWSESRWWDGADTFNEGSEVIGIDARVMLKDGIVIRYRYDGTASDLIIAIVSD